MSQRVPSDHSSVSTIDATLAQSGATNRPCIEISADDAAAFPANEVVRLVLDDTEHRSLLRSELSGDGARITGAYDSPKLARNPGDGENRLVDWFDASNLSFGRTVHVDVVAEGFLYGVRSPGERAVYTVPDQPDDSLSSIADELEE